MAKEDDVKKVQTAPVKALTVADIVKSGEFVKEQTGFAAYWKPRLYCHICTPLNVGDPGRVLGEREFTCQAKGHHEQLLERAKASGENVYIGSSFLGRVMARDVQETADPDKPFVRWLLMATRVGIECQQGPADEAETQMVNVSEPFTMSEYKTLPFQEYYGLEVIGIAKGKRAIKDGHTLWTFDFMVPKDTKKMLDERRVKAANEARLFLEKQTKMLQEAKATRQAEALSQAQAE